MLEKSFSISTLSAILLLLSSLRAVDADAQSLQTYVKPDSIETGGVFTISLVLNQDTIYTDIAFPDSAAFGPDFLLRERHQYRLNDLTDSLVLDIQYFGTDDISLTPLQIRLNKNGKITTLMSDPIFIAHRSLLPEEEAAVRPPKPIFSFPRAWWPYVLLFLAGAAAAYLVFRYLQNREKKPAIQTVYTPPPFVNPLDRLEDELAQLKQSDLEVTKDFKTFYVRLGDALRLYYEDLYRIPALESTTREVMRFVDVFGVNEEMKKITRSVLNEADMVKFAKFTPGLEQAWAAHQKMMEFLDYACRFDAGRIERMKEEHEQKHAPKTDENNETEPEVST
jgi:hypothetical protein